MNRALQVLSPSFLVWLENHSPEAYAFELVAGSLVCNVKGHKKSAGRARQPLHRLGGGRAPAQRGGRGDDRAGPASQALGRDDHRAAAAAPLRLGRGEQAAVGEELDRGRGAELGRIGGDRDELVTVGRR